jgi:hypothetical protein
VSAKGRKDELQILCKENNIPIEEELDEVVVKGGKERRRVCSKSCGREALLIHQKRMKVTHSKARRMLLEK